MGCVAFDSSGVIFVAEITTVAITNCPVATRLSHVSSKSGTTEWCTIPVGSVVLKCEI